MRKPTALELSRRRLLMGTAASVAPGSMTSASRAQPAQLAESPGSSEVPSMSTVRFTVGARHEIEVDSRTTLLDALRDHLDVLTGPPK
jgi:xanthine dehydrogenase YagT iron-sulfur-binding subunit